MLIYLLKSSFLLLLLWPALYLVLRYSGRFQLNRWLLLGMMVATVGWPFVSLPSPVPVATEVLQRTIKEKIGAGPRVVVGWPSGNTESVEAVPNGVDKTAYTTVGETLAVDDKPYFLGLAYVTGLLALSMLLLARLVRLWLAHRRSESVSGEYRLRQLSAKCQGQAYTFGRSVYLSKDVLNGPDARHILAHERVHARQLHTLDVLIGELFLILLWFHPVAWWLRVRQRANLEYLTDRTVLQGGHSRRAYQLALVRYGQGIPAGVGLPLPFSEPSLRTRMLRMRSVPRHWAVMAIACTLLVGWLGFARTILADENGADGDVESIAANILDELELTDLNVPTDLLNVRTRELSNDTTKNYCAPCYYQRIYSAILDEPIKSVSINFKRLPRPDELDRLRGLLWNIGETDLQIYADCRSEFGHYNLELTHQGKTAALMENIKDNHLYEECIILRFTDGVTARDGSSGSFGRKRVALEIKERKTSGTENEQLSVSVNGKEFALNTGVNYYQKVNLKRELVTGTSFGNYYHVSSADPPSFSSLRWQPLAPAKSQMLCLLKKYGDASQGHTLFTKVVTSESAQAFLASTLGEKMERHDIEYYRNQARIDQKVLERMLRGKVILQVGWLGEESAPTSPIIVQIVNEGGC